MHIKTKIIFIIWWKGNLVIN